MPATCSTTPSKAIPGPTEVRSPRGPPTRVTSGVSSPKTSTRTPNRPGTDTRGSTSTGATAPEASRIPPATGRTSTIPPCAKWGVGVVNGSNGSVGPQVVAQALGDRPGITPFVTGVVYYDLDGDQFYDLGEGIGGVTVRVSGSPAYALTARSGGYSVPVSGAGPRTVTFSVPGLPDVEKTVTLAGSQNVKVDHFAGLLRAGPLRIPAAPRRPSQSLLLLHRRGRDLVPMAIHPPHPLDRHGRSRNGTGPVRRRYLRGLRRRRWIRLQVGARCRSASDTSIRHATSISRSPGPFARDRPVR
jgi:hypothetical protein